MQIGRVKLANRVISAPMAGVTDRAFRVLAREAGCGLVCTEMVSDQALMYNNKKTLRMVDFQDEPGPLSVQIFGSNVEYMAKAAQIVVSQGADIVDINMGCPAPKIVKNNEGCALMKNPQLAADIVKAVVEAVEVPVTVKMRKGWDQNSVNAVELAERAVAAGAQAITVHGRTRDQFYSGAADWDIIRRVKEAVEVPVIGNGDIWSPLDARDMMEQTACDGVMIGRAAMGNPWIFKQTIHYLETGQLLPGPQPEERIQMAIRHLEMIVDDKGAFIGVSEMRKHAAWYTKGFRGAASLRQRINQAQSPEELKEVLLSALP
ncbi:tRNA dihydrouridine synthase DusB [Desulfofalx alkaliphila]|uniref:tRNA dihydrouridine synthase DusB n=1 Tax=Desulfofalx alkaliphila TaxID=105483 RepID=UPI0004E10474|nr:tRNA dihydrouridine synthase DusB [Desulfofalx alkaliphila]